MCGLAAWRNRSALAFSGRSAISSQSTFRSRYWISTRPSSHSQTTTLPLAGARFVACRFTCRNRFPYLTTQSLPITLSVSNRNASSSAALLGVLW